MPWPSSDSPDGNVAADPAIDQAPTADIERFSSKRTRPPLVAPISRTASSQTRSNTDCGSSSRATAVATRRRAPCSKARRRFSASRPRSSCSAACRAVMSSTTAAITGGVSEPTSCIRTSTG